MKDYEIKVDKLPRECDINNYILEKAFNMIKYCKYCRSMRIEMHYSNNREYEEPLFPTNKTKHYINCTCHKCGAEYEIKFTTKNKANLRDEYEKLYAANSEYVKEQIDKGIAAGFSYDVASVIATMQ